jgi:hypothetical protein
MPYNSLDIGLVRGNGGISLCGRNRDGFSTGLSTKSPAFHPIHILDIDPTPNHIWGYGFMAIFSSLGTSPQRRSLIHKKSRLIHKADSHFEARKGIPYP